MKILCVRGKPELCSVFIIVSELSGKQEKDRKHIMLDLIDFAATLPKNQDTINLLKRAAKQRIENRVAPEEVPSSIKLVLDIEEKTWDDAMDIFKYAFGLKSVQIPYFIKVAGAAYIEQLRAQNAELGVPEIPEVTASKCENALSLEEFKSLSGEDKLVEIYKLLLSERGLL